MTSENSMQAKIANKLSERLPKLEMIFALTSFIGLILRILNISYGGIILVISLSSLAIIYFLLAYKSSSSDSSGLYKFIYKLIYWAISISVLGILFRLQHYPNSNNMLIIGCVTVLFALIISILKKLDLGRSIIIRSIIIIIIGLSLNFTSLGKFDQPSENQRTDINNTP
jgi:hypothetical protein